MVLLQMKKRECILYVLTRRRDGAGLDVERALDTRRAECESARHSSAANTARGQWSRKARGTFRFMSINVNSYE